MIHIAYKTLAAVKQAVEADQGARYRTLLRQLMPLAEDAYRGEDDGFRSHLGASVIGEDCARKLWYDFHWAKEAKHDARLLQLFNRGHLEEPRFAALLGAAGVKLHQYEQPGKQFRITMFGGHLGGSLDGVAESIPDIDAPVLCEFKTHNKESFAKLAGKNWLAHVADPSNVAFTGEGVRASKFRHYVQSQLYREAYQLSHGLYMAVCKDDDSLYAEILPADPAISGAFANRAREIIFAAEPPARIKNDPTWWQCKFCDKAPVCYGKEAPARNCRTCTNSQPANDGTWNCFAFTTGPNPMARDKQAQLRGCTDWKYYQIRKL